MGLISVHCAVLLFGLAGLFGKTVALSSAEITWGRTTLAALALGCALALRREPIRIKKNEIVSFVVMGILLALHWWSFFYAIQLSTVAIGLLSFASFPIIVMLLEPFTDKVEFRFTNLLYALLSLVGVSLVLPDLSFQTTHSIGGLWGIFSGALYAVVTVMNRRFVRRYSALTIGFWQYFFAGLILSVVVIPKGISLNLETIVELVVLGFIFTALAHGLFIHGLRDVRAGTASLIGALEPVYGVTAAAFILEEIPALNTVLGGGLILAVILHASRPNHKASDSPTPGAPA